MIHRLFSYALVAFAGLVIAPAAAQAHPHIWVTVKSEVVYGPDGTVTGVRHAWTFDDMFSVFATQGIESKKKGEFTREELARSPRSTSPHSRNTTSSPMPRR